MSYNILFGFQDKDTQNKPTVLNPRRLEEAKEVVRGENPDVLVLCEAFFGDLAKYPKGMDYKKLFGYPHMLGAWYEEYNGQVILSRYPFRKKSALPVGHSLLSSERRYFPLVQMDLGAKVVSVLGGYTALGKERQKREDWERAFAYDEVHNAESLIVVGDLNAFSDEDRYDREALVTGFRHFIHTIPEFSHQTPENVVDDFLRREAIPFLRSRGLVDTHQPTGTLEYTLPTDLITKDKSFAIRIDYILATPNLKVKRAYTVRNAHAEAASDHYPIVTLFEI